jgi:hypothetical protein
VESGNYSSISLSEKKYTVSLSAQKNEYLSIEQRYGRQSGYTIPKNSDFFYIGSFVC